LKLPGKEGGGGSRKRDERDHLKGDVCWCPRRQPVAKKGKKKERHRFEYSSNIAARNGIGWSGKKEENPVLMAFHCGASSSNQATERSIYCFAEKKREIGLITSMLSIFI